MKEGVRQITALRHTVSFQRFASEIRRRLEEQRAFGAGRLVPEESPLAALAVTIGVDLTLSMRRRGRFSMRVTDSV